MLSFFIILCFAVWVKFRSCFFFFLFFCDKMKNLNAYCATPLPLVLLGAGNASALSFKYGVDDVELAGEP